MAPPNFTLEIEPKLLNNKTVYTKATWKHPRSDYPIEKYKISLSLYLEASNGSLWQNEVYVPEVSTYIYLHLFTFPPNYSSSRIQ